MTVFELTTLETPETWKSKQSLCVYVKPMFPNSFATCYNYNKNFARFTTE